MKVPLQISFRGIPASDDIKALVEEKTGKLEEVCDHINSCRVAIEKTQEHQERGNPYRVRLDITVTPGHEIAVRREPSRGDLHKPLEFVVRDAFHAARGQLIELTDRQRREVKTHPHQQANALVSKVFTDQGYGFLETIDGREIYFHQNSVLNNGFERLKPGTAVRYVEEEGQKGPQASTVHIIEQISDL
ncbi:MAG: HPF/RaiA family ribosome-associated protein [Candidatus Omnitrophica bacterium]|nr:HPF/RaiA family ribosome-associated protein [Candidatus Omnitrophota bacterium]